MDKAFAEIFSTAVLLALSLCLQGCGDLGNRSDHDGGYTTRVSNWSPDSVHVTCRGGNCPSGVGAVIFAQNIGGAYRLQRCTATLLDGDRMLTNSHCGKAFMYDSAYFFVNQGGRTVHYSVGSRLFDREEGIGLEAGMGADVAIFKLSERVDGIEPRRLSRRIPDNMQELVGFKIDEPGGMDAFVNFDLNRVVCTTVPRQALFGGGSDDLNVGLALFGCDILKGNSGTPLFAVGNVRDVQVLVNTSYPFQSGGSNKLDAVFGQKPDFLNENFAMGNRLHCMDIDGQPPSAVRCARATVDDQIRKPFQMGSVRIASERLTQLNSSGSSAIWGLRVYKMKVKRSDNDRFPRSGMVLMPYPVCLRTAGALVGDLSPQQVQYLTLNMDGQGVVVGHVEHVEILKGRYMSISPHVPNQYEVSFARDYRAGGVYEPLRFEGDDPQAMSSNFVVKSCAPAARAELRDDEPTVIPQYLVR